MVYLNDDIFDAGLQLIVANCDALYICSQEPASFAEATSTYALGSKSSPVIGSPEDGASSGRRVIVQAIADGNVSSDGTATHFALTDSGNSRLLATQALGGSVGVTNGNTFTLTELSITIPDAA